ncbi:MAG: hypothetical protein O7J95_18340, partial [Planctomycetota bacterium]|nr:hypothetical protein [Planctomycetota bacterium]
YKVYEGGGGHGGRIGLFEDVDQQSGVQIDYDVARSVLADGVSYDITGASSPSHSGTVEEALEVVAISGVTTSPIALTTGPIASLDDSHDIGGVPTLGSSVVNGTTITVSGSGADIWDGNDRFQYAYKEVSGDFTATVRVTDVQDPPNDRWGRFGIMARYTCDNNSKYSFACIPYRGEVIRAGNPQDSDARRHQSRRDHLNNGNTRDRQVIPGSINNAMGPHNGWIRLQRNGNYFWSSFAADVDGQPGTWHVAGGDYHQGEAPGSLLVGLVSSSHGSGGSNVMVVDYDNLTIETLDMPDMAIVKGDEVLLEEDFEAGLDPATIDVTSAGGNFTPAVVAGRLRVTVDGENDSRNAVHISADGLNLGDRAFCAEFDVFISGNPTEADGGVFAVTQGSFADSIGRVGGGGGAAGWNFGDHNENNGRRPSFAYEFDTWDGGHGDNDPPGGFGANRGSGLWHVGIDFNESITSAVNHVEFGVEDIFTLFNNADGAHMEVCYAPMGDQSLIQTWLTANDGSFERTLMGEVIGPRLNGDVYISITGATGGANETKEVDNIVITAACTENADSVSIAGAPAEPASEADLTAVVGGAEGDVTYAWSVEGDAAIVGAADGETVAIRCDGDGTATVTVTTSDAECGNSVDDSIELQCLQAGLLLVPGDTSGDGVVDTTDVIRLAGFLFVDSAANSLPCEGIHTDPGNLALLDFNGSGAVDIADLSAEAGWLFLGTPAHVLNTAAMGPGCTLIADCELRAGLEDTAICTP